MLKKRCMAAGCVAPAVNAHKIVTPSAGYPIVRGSIVTAYYLTFLSCADHRLTMADVPTAEPVIRAGMMRKGFEPDHDRATVVPVALDDPEWLAFLEYKKAG